MNNAEINFTSTVSGTEKNFTEKLRLKNCVNRNSKNFTGNFDVDGLMIESLIFAIERQLKIDELRNHDIEVQVYVAFSFFNVICLPIDYLAARLIFNDVLVPFFSENLVIKFVNV